MKLYFIDSRYLALIYSTLGNGSLKEPQKFTYITYFGTSGTCLKKGVRQRRSLVKWEGGSHIIHKYVVKH